MGSKSTNVSVYRSSVPLTSQSHEILNNIMGDLQTLSDKECYLMKIYEFVGNKWLQGCYKGLCSFNSLKYKSQFS